MGAAAALAMLAALPFKAQAQPAQTTANQDQIAAFFRGKTINGLIGTVVGGEYDQHARLVFRFMGRHIPGNPTIVPQNMLGGGGIRMANYLYQVAPRDGTALAVVNNSFPASQAMGEPALQVDTGQLNWIGAISANNETMSVWKSAGITTFDEAKTREIIAGSTAKGSITYTFPRMLNELFGTRFKVVQGYTGGNEINVAMERGEVQARNNTWSSWKSTRADWLKNRDLIVIVQSGATAKDLAVPNIEDIAKTGDDRRVIQLLVSGAHLGRPIATTQGVPAERVEALRAAFDATMKDPEFLAMAEQSKIEVDPVRGTTLQKLVAGVLATPAPLIARGKAIME
jgi:tripartite-type tricarboxylate transporter receptor subunit TctC